MALVAGIVFWLLYRVGIGVACFVSRCCVACVPAYLESSYCVFSLVKFLIHIYISQPILITKIAHTTIQDLKCFTRNQETIEI